ncbi:MAG: RagB/SusD family nutrient uptake outer membrane protein [Candidatus Kapabacteria bacterium]|jgi:hypothetical protein|nr:RagB/SusD family nutrient uptake outer membrane protein [Candidatus Kapabacteria bacterium]
MPHNSSKAFSNLAFRIATLCVWLVLCCSAWSCQAFVQGVASPINTIIDKDLNSESQIMTLFSSISGYLGQYWRFASLYLATLSDEFQTTEGIATNFLPLIMQEFDNGMPRLERTDREWGNLGAARFHAQDLIDRVPKITFTQDSNRRKCLFIGYFHVALIQHHQAAFWGLTPQRGGGVLLGGPFIPSAAMHDTALRNFTKALEFTRSDYERRLVNSFLARIHLIEGRWNECLLAARLGLREGDSPLSLLYPPTSANIWYDNAGVNHHIIPTPRYRAFVEADPAEAGRIPLVRGQNPVPSRTVPYFVQDKYTTDTSPIDLITWQEVSLMIAEALVLQNDDFGALQEVNRVRAAVPRTMGVPALSLRTTTNLDSIKIERKKQLFATGLRTIDQRRFNEWHFSPAMRDIAWRHLPISQSERNFNPNLSQ